MHMSVYIHMHLHTQRYKYTKERKRTVAGNRFKTFSHLLYILDPRLIKEFLKDTESQISFEYLFYIFEQGPAFNCLKLKLFFFYSFIPGPLNMVDK